MTTLQCIAPPSSKDLLSLAQLDGAEIRAVLDTAAAVKADPGGYASALAGRTMVMIFEKPSLRTRMSFEVGFSKLGGTAVYLDQQHERLGARESISDCGKNLERWVDVVVARTFAHETLETLAASTRVPVINALSDRYHPCQALADAMTLREHFAGPGDLAGIRLAYVGDGNNVCHSLVILAAKLGMTLTVITPPGHRPCAELLDAMAAEAEISGAAITLAGELEAAAGHHAVYTDTWVSMGQEAEGPRRRSALHAYQITPAVMDLAGPSAVFMHCLPAHRGEEVAAEVIDSARSVVFDQAENRMHAQNAVLMHLLAREGSE